MRIPDGVKAGKISKPHGLRGDVNIILEPEAGTLIEPGDPLFVEIDGQRVPFFTEEIEILSPEQAIIKFTFLDSLEEARELTGCTLYFDPSVSRDDVQEEGDEFRQFIAYTAYDKDAGLLGEIVDHIANPSNPLFVLEYEKREIMIPARPEFIQKTDSVTREVHFILPEGLLEL